MKNCKIKVPYISDDIISKAVESNGINKNEIILLRANKAYTINPKERTIINTGLKIAVPQGFELQVRNAGNYNVQGGLLNIVNEPGTIDSDYRGDVGVIVYNPHSFKIELGEGDVVAKGVFNKVEQVIFADINEKEPYAIKVTGEGNAQIPFYATDGAAGVDIVASERKIIKAGETAKIETGLTIDLPPYMVGEIRSRSGLAAKKGIKANNDLIKNGKNVAVILTNTSSEDFIVESGDRIAQIVFMLKNSEKANVEIYLKKVSTLDETSRAAGGFGSTGVSAKKN